VNLEDIIEELIALFVRSGFGVLNRHLVEALLPVKLYLQGTPDQQLIRQCKIRFDTYSSGLSGIFNRWASENKGSFLCNAAQDLLPDFEHLLLVYEPLENVVEN
jgi:hypothetical protein